MLWAFFDKIFGLGFTTAPDVAWLTGASPTTGFLAHGTQGPFASIFQSLVGNAVVDWLFMLGLGLIGVALILGIGVRIAGWSGALMMLLMWLAILPPEHHPFLDEHIIYAFVFIGLARVDAGHVWGLGAWWSKTGLVKKLKFLT